MQKIKFEYDFMKTLQAIAQLISHEPHRQISRLRLMKLLYIADRESLKEEGSPISNDSIAAMQHGPVPSNTYDIIKGHEEQKSKSKVFHRYFVEHNHQISMIDDPGRGKLNRYEIDKLREVSEKYKHLTDKELVDETHTFTEWINNNPGTSSRPISVEDILSALGVSEARKQVIFEESEMYRGLKKMMKAE